MRRAEQLDLVRGFRRGLFESRSEVRRVHLARSSSAAALPSQAAQGHPVNTGRDSWGGLPLVTFLGRARKVTSRRAAPGLLSALKMKTGTNLFILKPSFQEKISLSLLFPFEPGP